MPFIFGRVSELWGVNIALGTPLPFEFAFRSFDVRDDISLVEFLVRANNGVLWKKLGFCFSPCTWTFSVVFTTFAPGKNRAFFFVSFVTVLAFKESRREFAARALSPCTAILLAALLFEKSSDPLPIFGVLLQLCVAELWPDGVPSSSFKPSPGGFEGVGLVRARCDFCCNGDGNIKLRSNWNLSAFCATVLAYFAFASFASASCEAMVDFVSASRSIFRRCWSGVAKSNKWPTKSRLLVLVDLRPYICRRTSTSSFSISLLPSWDVLREAT